jgi:hypothetical protein
MPITRYVEKGIVFTPQALAEMSKALEGRQKPLGSTVTKGALSGCTGIWSKVTSRSIIPT